MSVIRCVLMLGIWCSLVSTRAWAQAEPPGGEPEVEPAAISLSKIGEEADRTKTRLEEVKNRIAGGPSLTRVDRELPELGERIAELEADTPTETDVLSERELDDLTFAWSQIAVQVRALQSQLGDESDRFEGELQRVQEMLERWRATAQAPTITPTARDQAKELERATTEVNDQIRDHLDTIHDAQARVSATGQVVTQHLVEFAAIRDAQRARVLTRGEPLWRVHPLAGESPTQLAVRTVRRQADQIGEFLREHIGSLVVLLVGSLLIWRALIVLGRRPAGNGPDLTQGLESALLRPGSGAVVLAIALFALLGPPVPWALRQAMWLLTLLPLLRLLGPTPYRSIALVFSGPLLLSLLADIIPEMSMSARYPHLVVSVFGPHRRVLRGPLASQRESAWPGPPGDAAGRDPARASRWSPT